MTNMDSFWEALDTAMEPLTDLFEDIEADEEDDDDWRDLKS